MSGLILPRHTPAAPGIQASECWLRPFQAPGAQRSLRARARLSAERLTVRFVLEGELDDLWLPEAGDLPRRRDGLWLESCFEAFLARPEDLAYRELNLSPQGHWAAYRFTAPRQGMRLEAELTELEWRTHRVPGHFAIRFTLGLARLGMTASRLRLGLSAILLRRDGQREFWALDHPAPQPDFHDPAGHLLELAPPR